MTGTTDTGPAQPVAGPGRLLRATCWWAATLFTLVVLDDLTFGPAFWALSRWQGPLVATLAVFAVYVPAQIFLVRRATAPEPGRIAHFFLRRLELDRRSSKVAERETKLHNRVMGAVSAIGLTLVIGGVLPPILLHRAGWSIAFVRRLSYVTAPVYAAEFALLHGVLPSAF